MSMRRAVVALAAVLCASACSSSATQPGAAATPSKSATVTVTAALSHLRDSEQAPIICSGQDCADAMKTLLDAVHQTRAAMQADPHADGSFYSPAYVLADQVDHDAANVPDWTVALPTTRRQVDDDADNLVQWLIAHPTS
jgi:hypothetical protein